jgi:hypothetical protein
MFRNREIQLFSLVMAGISLVAATAAAFISQSAVVVVLSGVMFMKVQKS